MIFLADRYANVSDLLFFDWTGRIIVMYLGFITGDDASKKVRRIFFTILKAVLTNNRLY